MTVTNIAPRTMIVDPAQIVPGYTTAYALHSGFTDLDVVGKAFWVQNLSTIAPITMLDIPNVDTNFVVLTGLSPNTNYGVQGTFYDTMVDDELLAARIGINLSEQSPFTTLENPTFDSLIADALPVDVGVGTPIVRINLLGGTDLVVIDKAPNEDGVPGFWERAYYGSGEAEISIPTAPGEWFFRVRGIVQLPDGLTQDFSPFDQSDVINVTQAFAPPEAPEDLEVNMVDIIDGIQRFDARVSWNWDRGDGAAIREFILEYVSQEDYNNNQWDNASVLNGGTATAVVITGFPVNVAYRFRVGARSWGPADLNTTYSDELEFTFIPGVTPVETVEATTGIEVTYSHIRAYNGVGQNRIQTFNLDAATGNLAIGALDQTGTAPVSVDGATGDVNISGRVITDTIVAASYVLANLTGQDNPVIRTSTKPNYAAAADGFWMGYDPNDARFKFDLGNATDFLRWDGDRMIISSNVQIGLPGNQFIDINEGIQGPPGRDGNMGPAGNYIGNIYIVSNSQPPTPTGNAFPPTGWSSTPLTGGTIWISSAIISSQTNLVIDTSAWSTPVQFTGQPGLDGRDGTDAVGTVLAYRVATSTPSRPTSTAIPPSGWTTTLPSSVASNQRIYVISGSRTGTASNIDGQWSFPAILSGRDGTNGTNGTNGTDGQDGTNGVATVQIYRAATSTPARPTSRSIPPSGWSTTPPSPSSSQNVYACTSTRSGSNNTAAADWSNPIQISGRDGRQGIDGTRGAGIYAQAISGLSSFSTSQANAFFSSNFGTGPVLNDVITQYNSGNPTVSFTRRWNGSSWVAASLVIHGDAIVDGTLVADKFATDTALINRLGVTAIYDNDALAQGNPERDFNMKIDLANGSIFIR